MDAVAEIRRARSTAACRLIGFSGSPGPWPATWSRGGSSDDYRKVKSLAYSRPDLMHHILDVTAQAVVKHLNAQIEAGPGGDGVRLLGRCAVRGRVQGVLAATWNRS